MEGGCRSLRGERSPNVDTRRRESGIKARYGWGGHTRASLDLSFTATVSMHGHHKGHAARRAAVRQQAAIDAR
eukprot:6212313-Pleurochrysis_carterae.AAC.14